MLQLKSLKNSKTNRPINNQYMLITPRFIFFISYETFICAYDKLTKNLIIFDYIKNLNVSRTTAKYLYQFLNEVNFTFKNFHDDKKIEREKVMYKKLELASRSHPYSFNVIYKSDEDVESLMSIHR